MIPQRVLWLGKKGDALCERAVEYATRYMPGAEVHLGRRGEPLPPLAGSEPWDLIISYLSPWIVPAEWLRRARVAINFHPGPPEYPGVGCTNFAMYEGADRYGVTCHHMASAVDTGAIIRVDRFPLYREDTVWSLTHRAYAHLAVLFYEMFDLLVAGRPLPVSEERWTRRPFRREELNALCRATREMSKEEIQRRIRATTFPGYPAVSFVDEPAGTGAVS